MEAASNDFDQTASAGQVLDLEYTLARRVPLPSFVPSLDPVLALVALILLAPLLTLVAIAIRVDSEGPVFFRQTRTGLNGRRFQIYKFRSMRVQENGPVVQQATRGDLRVTRVGRILRKTSLDELPQLLNVLRGEMALVGPRPHALAHDEYYGQRIPSYTRRFAVKPGLTGWAQINGSRGETPTLAHMKRRIELDLWYIERRSLGLDLVILLRTVLTEVTGRTNAY
ncbi:exopolysaccharide biosynthesis polyprenyl glycosylphosphotransferase [Methylobacterium sp. ID0610]|uniref:exopolysaccharide biosynthesis polyprenyl glycosylphosphotransferase n=1 Tax=Methylobacterium carpenticola TaxID=3344827 RepID=UPI003696A725